MYLSFVKINMQKFKNFLFLYVQGLILAGGTIFAWYQWVNEYFFGCTSCSTVPKQFFSKCFIGALFFTAAFVLNVAMIYRAQKKEK